MAAAAVDSVDGAAVAAVAAGSVVADTDTGQLHHLSNSFVGVAVAAGPARHGRWSRSRRRSSAAEGTTCPAETSSTGCRS